MTKTKPASTVMLARDYAGSVEILLLKRNKALAFAGGLWVFPGGKIDIEEQEQASGELNAAKLAAVRETKEEANLDIDAEKMIFFSHWTTPVIEPRRYATWFFFAEANELMNEVEIDDSEIKAHQWINPQDALDELRKGNLAMMPPTLMSLELIRKCKSVAEITQLLNNHDPIYILPVLQRENKKMICLYEGDAAYDQKNVIDPAARHRLVLDFKNNDFVFEFSNCKNVRPVNGGMHL